MSWGELIAKSLANLQTTYLAIGLATPEARLVEDDGFVMCTCGLKHAVGNFAIVRSLRQKDALELREAASSKQGFNVYAFQAPETFEARRLLSEVGFAKSFQLSLMCDAGADDLAGCGLGPDGMDLCEARGAQERRDVAEFMASQFFFRQPRAVRTRIAEATSDCGIPLFSALVAQRRVGAVMVSRTDDPQSLGAGVLGIYNLCVARALRGQGHGTNMVRALRSLASQEGRVAALQCDPELVRWYRSCGFREVGNVDVFTLDRR